jgi:hypothetical protein
MPEAPSREEIMHVDSIREALRRQPFVPFFLRMNDGRVFHVPHPEYIALSRRVVVVIDSATDAAIFLEPVLIASLKPVVPPQKATPSGGNP